MKKPFYTKTGLLGTALACFLIAVLLQHVSFHAMSDGSRVRRFEKTLQDKEQELYTVFDQVDALLEAADPEEDFSVLSPWAGEEWIDRGVDLFVFESDTLVFWTSNSVITDDLSLKEAPAMVFPGNGWAVRKERITGNRHLVGLIRIKTVYPYENHYLENRFQKDFRVPEGTEISFEKGEHRIPVMDSWGKELFYLDFSSVSRYSPFQSFLSLLLYYLGIFLFLLYFRYLIKSIKPRAWRNTGIFLGALVLVLLNALLLKMPVPRQMADLEIFSPQLFAASDLLPSLAGLLTTSLFLFFLVYIFYREFRLGERHKGNLFHVLQVFYFVVMVLYFQGIVLLFRSLVVHSSISFETYRVLDISVFTFVGLFILAMHFAALTLLLDKFFSLFGPVKTLRNQVIVLILFALLSWAAGTLFRGGADFVMALLIAAVAGVVVMIRASGRAESRYSTFFLLIFLFSVFSVYQISRYTAEKRRNEMMVLAVDLSAEHDPVAELLLKNMETDIATDQELGYLIHEGYTDQMVIDDYLRGNYFSGFWEKYDLHFTLCSPEDSLYIEPFTDTWYPCYEFFDELFADSRFRIPGSRFYFVDNMNGRISYFAGFKFYSSDSSAEASLFLELDSRLVTEELGYPELLLRDRPRNAALRRHYTYAKYSNGELITQGGDYSYSLKPDDYTTGREEFEYTETEDYNHLAYNLDQFNTIVVSSRKVSLLNRAITFTYIFVFFYLLLTLYLLATNIPFMKENLQFNIKNKIQYTMIGVLLMSLLLIGGGTVFFSMHQYRERHNENLSEKIQSVYIELIHKLEFETSLSPDWQASGYASLDELLQKFSNVFFTDINLYDPRGNLLATSRPEIFTNKLIGPIMHPAAYRELSIKKAAEFVQEETIGNLRYLSAYVPFRNNENQVLAYLNLPYFTRQQALTMEISNLVVAVVNLYVLLITLSILIAVVISTQITQPLRMLQSKFGKITLGKSNEKIQYEARDEIGGIVREYNRMVDELATSAEKLARSERESAWREMAKQIAHEIKNPLTPMKLSVQHLQRAPEKDPQKQKENIQRITRTLIEQIDTLSAIATEFSNFAKMPRANNEIVNLEEKIRKISELFRSTENIRIDTRFEGPGPPHVYADPEQLTRVFINLLKNAIQSIPEDREGKLGIYLETLPEKVRVQVCDNGRGIPDELGDRLFQPNFTTKSSGMGMGLAIAKSIIENAGGNISYETELGKGSTFVVELPLVQGEGD